MRPHPCFVVALCAAAACSHDTTSASPPTPGTSTSSNGLNISIDSTFTNRTTVVATAIPAIVHVTLAGQPSAGVTVSWIVPAGGGSVSPASSTTDASGVATATWTMGDTARAYTLTAAITGASVTLQATATAGDPVTLSKVSADTIAVAAGASTLVTVRAVDKLGNPVSGVVVSWASTGGALTITATTTGASGNAEVAFSSDAAPRSYTVTATAAGLGTATFIVVGR